MPTGNETRAAILLKRKLDREGIECEILTKEQKRGNLLARLPGEKNRPKIMYLSHLDVVPIEGESM